MNLNTTERPVGICGLIKDGPGQYQKPSKPPIPA